MFGFTTNNISINKFFIRKPLLQKIFRYKFNPILLGNDYIKNDLNIYLKVLSQISIGPTYKTTSIKRHWKTDSLIVDKIAQYKGSQCLIADIGVSDGSSALSLIESLVKFRKAKLKLFDKYNYLEYVNYGCAEIYKNSENFIVYIKLGIFLFNVYRLRIRSNSIFKSKIYFINPLIEKHGYVIEYFDVFETKIDGSFYIIKCANVLNRVYFSNKKIIDAMRNLISNLDKNGFLYIVHNIGDKEEYFVISKEKMSIVESSSKDKISMDIINRALSHE